MKKQYKASVPTESIIQQDGDQRDSVEIAFMDEVFKYAVGLGYSPTLSTEVDDSGVTHFFLCNASLKNADSTEVKLEKMIEIFMIDNRIKAGSSDFKALLAKTTDMIDIFTKERA